MAQKSKPLPNDQKIVLNRSKACEWDNGLFVKLKYESSTVADIRYFLRDLLSDLNNYAWPANQRYASDTVNDVLLCHQPALASCESYV